MEAHAQATRSAIDVGFDVVEVHLEHSYLASSFLSPNINRRRNSRGQLAGQPRQVRPLDPGVGRQGCRRPDHPCWPK
ncbi:hypothetical protein [Nocardia salmonicida]|uniref:oxidoreductase n=1 Tax=Nocardia salmonicida TaxID=53431 RepID=UPI0037A4C4B3